MAPKTFESRIQDLVYNVDVGIGLRLIKAGLYLLFIFLVILLYTATQFRGLKDAQAMDYAQLGRNLMVHKQLVTQHVRPLSLWHLEKKSPELGRQLVNHPDIFHAPGYPALLAGWFTLTRAQFPVPGEGVYAPEFRIVVLNHLFVIMTAILLYLMALRLFDSRVGFLGVTLFLLSDVVWRDSISGIGISIVVFWSMAAFYAAIAAVDRLEEEPASRRWLWPAAFALLFCVLAFLTRYAAIVIVPGIALYICLAIKRNGWWAWGLAFIAIFLVAVSPWFVRNIVVSGSPLGLAPYTALNDSSAFAGNSLERSRNPELDASTVVSALQVKWMGNMQKFYNHGTRNMGEGVLICLFLTTLFYRFVRRPVHTFRWCMLLSLVLLMNLAAFFGEATFRLVHMFWPIIIIYALAFFYLLLERLQLRARILNLSVIGSVVMLSALPLIFTFLPPRAGAPYPPYRSPDIGYVSSMLQPQEIMCSDMSWATAWYGNRTSLLLPKTVEEFYIINDYTGWIRGMYFTPLTTDQPFMRAMRSPQYASWFPIVQGRIPGDFPLTQGRPIGSMEQLFITDRARWLE